jgi:serine protease inhibitor
MKQLLSLILCIGMLAFTGCGNTGDGKPTEQALPYETGKIGTNVVERNTQFAFTIFKQLNEEDKGKSIFISPLSISTALSMAYQGAGTTTKDAMAKALGYQGMDIGEVNKSYQNLLRYLRQADSKVELNISNSIWIRDGIQGKDDFLSVNKDIFNADANMLDFSKTSAADKINSWISDATKGKITKMIAPPIPEDAIMYLINAIYFKGDWKKQFEKKATFSTAFHTEDGKSDNIMMMSRNGKVEYGEVEGTKAVRLPYGKGKIAMYCILPDKGTSIDGFIQGMSFDKWTSIKESISKKEEVILQIPRFSLEYGIKELNESLSKLGMGEAFGDNADFSGIREDTSISRVLHKAMIEVNEGGSEAAAATVVEMRLTSAVIDPISFIADRPFVFVIADDETGSILFMGKLSEVK